MWVRQRHLHIGAHLFTRLLSNWVLGQPQLPINCFCPLSSLKLWFSESQQERNLNGVQTHHFREAFLQLPPGKPWSKPSPQPSVQLAGLWVPKAELNQSAQPNEEDHSLRDKIQKKLFLTYDPVTNNSEWKDWLEGKQYPCWHLKHYSHSHWWCTGSLKPFPSRLCIWSSVKNNVDVFQDVFYKNGV